MTILDTFIAAWNARDAGAVAACYLPAGAREQTAYPPERIEGRAALTGHVQAIMTAWPDCTLETRPVRADGAHITLEWTFRGTQRADYGPIPARGQSLELNGVSVMEMEGDLIREERVYWDGATLLAGAGML